MPRSSRFYYYLDKLKDYYHKYQVIPSFDILCGVFGVSSKGAVHKIFIKMLDLGFLVKQGSKFFPSETFLSIPMFESIRAGFPSPGDDDSRYEMNLHNYLIEHPTNTIFLKVKGDSMQDEGIVQGDIVIVDKIFKPKMGDIVVAIVDGGYTLKYLMKDDMGNTFLRAANSSYSDIYPKQELEIFGVVVGSFRKYK